MAPPLLLDVAELKTELVMMIVPPVPLIDEAPAFELKVTLLRLRVKPEGTVMEGHDERTQFERATLEVRVSVVVLALQTIIPLMHVRERTVHDT